MDIQQIVTWVLVLAASAYLARLGYASWKGMWNGRSGCGSGCAKCITAEIASHRRMPASGPTHRQTAVIPLSAVQRVSPKRDE